MNTWTCRTAAVSLSIAVLSGCGADLAALRLGGGIANTALPEAELAFGTVRLQPPVGYCVDSASLSENFAIMARCDRLGLPDAAVSEPLGLITASTSTGAGEALPAAQTFAAALDVELIATADAPTNAIIFRARKEDAPAGMDPEHWRAAATVGTQVLGLALYAPEGRPSEIIDGDSVLATVIESARRAD